jgi:hypothetical protein
MATSERDEFGLTKWSNLSQTKLLFKVFFFFSKFFVLTSIEKSKKDKKFIEFLTIYILLNTRFLCLEFRSKDRIAIESRISKFQC